ncbi:MAG: DNA alkylation repair protein [Gemmatimonadaceae bacterium]
MASLAQIHPDYDARTAAGKLAQRDSRWHHSVVSDAQSAKAAADTIRKELAALPDHSAAPLRAVRRRWSKELRQHNASTVLAIANSLVARGGFANRFVACELLEKHATARALLTASRLKRLGRGMSSWGEVDVFACYVSGPAWRNGQVSDAEMERWARSRDRWWRRAALVSTVPLNQKARGGSGDVRRTLRICRVLMQDRDQLVVQAMSWALRALATREPHQVRRFLERHGDDLSTRVIRETMNKITTGRKSGRT